ncbi:MAG: LD-carboxypeptidase [Candidatus Dadabacteria bacterium]|nr:MAG: LD-carboxypeptidase [Candidatus Dadabacteria bacterium]
MRSFYRRQKVGARARTMCRQMPPQWSGTNVAEKRYGTIHPIAQQPDAPMWLFAPSGAVRDPWRSRGLELLRRTGRPLLTGESLDARPSPFSAGSAELRLRDWRQGLAHGATAMLPARGGYGAVHLLEQAPLDETAERAPLWIGSSDCTFLQTALLQQTGLINVYSPMPCGQAADGDEVSAEALLALLSGKGCPTHLSASEQPVPGATEGELRGGCLSILAALCGTRWQPDGRDAVLLIEDVAEAPYRVERMLETLRLAGVMDGCRGIVFGTFPGCVDRSGNPDLIRDVLRTWSRRLGIPTLLGVPVGHGPGALPVPLGLPVRIEHATLTLLEAL